MLDRPLPPLPYDYQFPFPNMAEAFAYTYLASYSDQALQPRVLSAFQNAYGVGQIEVHAPVIGGRPGYLLAWTTINGMTKLIVAIEGTRNANQVFNWWNGANTGVRLPNSRGTVYSFFNTHANTIMTELLTNGTFVTALTNAGSPITFAGFSLGAACAELLGELVKVSNPTKSVSVIKFGSPRIGNFNYMDRRSRTVIRRSVYCGRDPIDIYPYTAIGAIVLNGVIPLGNVVAYCRDRSAQRYDTLGGSIGDFHEGGSGQVVQYARSLGLAIDTQNPWYDHGIDTYRLMYTGLSQNSRTINMYRFRYLEFNDENQWGLQFSFGQGITDAMKQLVAPQPDPVEWTLEISTEEDAIAAAQSFYGVSAGGEESGIGGGADDDFANSAVVADPVRPAVAEMRATPPPTFVAPMHGRRRR